MNSKALDGGNIRGGTIAGAASRRHSSRGAYRPFLSRFSRKTLRQGPGEALRVVERVKSSKTPLMVNNSLLRVTFEKPRPLIHRHFGDVWVSDSPRQHHVIGMQDGFTGIRRQP